MGLSNQAYSNKPADSTDSILKQEEINEQALRVDLSVGLENKKFALLPVVLFALTSILSTILGVEIINHSFKNGNFSFLGWAIPIFITGLVFGIVIWYMLAYLVIKRFSSGKRSKQIQGIVTTSDFHKKPGHEGGWLYKLFVTIQYNLNGEHLTLNYSPDKGWHRLMEKHEKNQEIYKPGLPVTLYYNPNNPSNIALDHGKSSDVTKIIIYSLLFVIIWSMGITGLVSMIYGIIQSS